MRSGSLAKSLRASSVCVLCRCCRAFPFHDRARIQPDDVHPDFPVFPVGTPAVAGAVDMQLKQTDAMKNHQNCKLATSSFAVDTCHRFPPPRRNGSLWGYVVPHGLETEDMGLPVPVCRLTALLCAPDLLPTEVHVRSLVFCRTSSYGGFRFRSFLRSMDIG